MTATTETTTTDQTHDRRWLTLGIIAIAQLMVVLDISIVNVALPSAQHSLGFANSDRQWIVTAYALAFGSLLLLCGRIGDLFGRKWTFIAGLIGFAGASALGGAAPDFAILAAARALQGAFGALLAPSALGLLNVTFTDPDERRRAFAVFGAVASGGGAIGLLLGGILTSYLSWRWCFYVNLAFAAVAAIGGFRLLANPPRNRSAKLDVVGTALASAGLFGVVFGFSQAQTHGWHSGETIIPLVVGAVLLVAFVVTQRTAAHPLLPLRIPRDRTRGGSYLAVGLTAVAIFGLFLFLTFFLQNVRGFSPVRTGLAFLPASAGIFTASVVANTRALPRFGSRAVITFGLTVAGIGLLWLTQLSATSGYALHVLPALIVSGLGFGSVFAPAINAATTGIELADTGAASALVNTMQQVGGSLGTSLLSTLAAEGTSRYLRSHHAVAHSNVILAASTHGFVEAFAISAGVMFAAAIICGSLIRGQQSAQPS